MIRHGTSCGGGRQRLIDRQASLTVDQRGSFDGRHDSGQDRWTSGGRHQAYTGSTSCTVHCLTVNHITSHSYISVMRCNLSFGTRGFRTAAPTVWKSLPVNVRSCVTLSTFCRHLKSHLFQSSFPHYLVTHLSTSDSLLTYLPT